MSVHLLDVNVFLALLWPTHESHALAHAWFAKTGRRGWATSPLTQLGVLRLLTNPVVTRGAVSPATALTVLLDATRQEGHTFWPLEHDFGGGLLSIVNRVQGYRQWTDAALLSQAVQHKGILVTLDAGVAELAGREFAGSVARLKAG